MEKIIVTSDQHLGYENSNVDDFNNFLDYLLESYDDVRNLILLGDLIDLWRQDISSLFLEFSQIANKILKLSITRKIGVHIVPGNHDYHLLNLENPGYRFMSLPSPITPMPSTANGSKKYIFKHGWEFDLAQAPFIMEAMCNNISDEAGKARSDIYHILEISKKNLNKDIKEIIDFHGGGQGYVENLLLPPEKRLQSYLSDVEKKAYQSVGEGETLIFGHTHRPFISSDHKLVNTGSWVSDAETTNTFVEIAGEQIRLLQFKDRQNIIDITAQRATDQLT